MSDQTPEIKTADIPTSLPMLINSRKKLDGSFSDANFNFKIDLPAHHKFNRVVVSKALIPKSYYIVPEGYNTFTLQEAKGNVVITVPPGNYTRSSFQKALQALLTANSPGNLTYTISYPATQAAADTGKFTYTSTGPASFQIGKYLYEQLGFNANTTVALPATSTNVLKFVEEDCLVLHSSIVESYKDDILAVFMVGGDPPFSSTNYECRDLKLNARKLSLTAGNSFSFCLTDEDSNVMDLGGLNFVFELVFFTE